MKVNIDKKECIHCGTCVSICPKVFELDKENISSVIDGADLAKNAECIEQAVDACPVQAISAK